MVCIVVGGAGYLGSHIVKGLLELKKNVIVIDTFENSFPTVFSGMANLENLTLQTEHEYIGTEAVEVIFHFVSLNELEYKKGPSICYENDVGAICHSLQLMKDTDCKTFVFSSSGSIYGDSKDNPSKESDYQNPITIEGRSKIVIEMIVQDFASVYTEKRFFCLRYFNIYGGREKSKQYVGLIPEMRHALQTDTPFVFHGGKSSTVHISDFVHISDAVSANMACLASSRSGYNCYNVGSGKGTPIISIVKSFKAKHPRLQVDPQPSRKSDPVALVANIEKIQQQIGWRPKKPQFDPEEL